jgi:hypothetical protein
VLLDHVVVVEQPLAGRSDIRHAIAIRVCVADLGEPAMSVLQDATRVVEAREERSAACLSAHAQPLTRRHLLRSLGQVLGTEQLAANGAGEAVLAVRADEGHNEGE